MKKILSCLFFFILVLHFLPAQQLPEITIVNSTGYTIYYAFVVQTASDDWGDEILGSEIVRSGESFTVRLPFPINVVNRYDIQLIDLDGDTYTKWDVLVTPNARIVFTFDDYDYVAAPVFNGPAVTIVNNTGYLIWWVYIASTASPDWEEERLGSNRVLQPGESISLNLPFPINVVNRYDIRLIDLDLYTYTKWDLVVSPNLRIVFTANDLD